MIFGSTLTPADVAGLAPAAVQRSFAEVVAAITGAVRSGQLTRAALDAAVLRVLDAGGRDPCRG